MLILATLLIIISITTTICLKNLLYYFSALCFLLKTKTIKNELFLALP